MPSLAYSRFSPPGWQGSLIAWKYFAIKSYLNLLIDDICRTSYERELLRLARERSPREKHDGLVSIIIPTYNRSNLLASRSVPSVLRQTYQNFEIIVVGDHCTDDTETKLRAFHDPRIKLINLSKRGNYPKDPYLRWLVAGTAPVNVGLKIASGDWIAHLDDDDEFSPDHIESLLNYALRNGYEVVYGKMECELNDGSWDFVGSYPPHHGAITRSSVMYKAYLKIFKYHMYSWKLCEPGDWNLVKRMLRAGARIGFIDKVVGKHYKERTHMRR